MNRYPSHIAMPVQDNPILPANAQPVTPSAPSAPSVLPAPATPPHPTVLFQVAPTPLPSPASSASSSSASSSSASSLTPPPPLLSFGQTPKPHPSINDDPSVILSPTGTPLRRQDTTPVDFEKQTLIDKLYQQLRQQQQQIDQLEQLEHLEQQMPQKYPQSHMPLAIPAPATQSLLRGYTNTRLRHRIVDALVRFYENIFVFVDQVDGGSEQPNNGWIAPEPGGEIVRMLLADSRFEKPGASSSSSAAMSQPSPVTFENRHIGADPLNPLNIRNSDMAWSTKQLYNQFDALYTKYTLKEPVDIYRDIVESDTVILFVSKTVRKAMNGALVRARSGVETQRGNDSLAERANATLMDLLENSTPSVYQAFTDLTVHLANVSKPGVAGWTGQKPTKAWLMGNVETTRRFIMRFQHLHESDGQWYFDDQDHTLMSNKRAKRVMEDIIDNNQAPLAASTRFVKPVLLPHQYDAKKDDQQLASNLLHNIY